MLKSRVLTAVGLLAGFLAAVFFLPHEAWILCVGAALSVAAWEWAGLSSLQRSRRLAYAALITGSALWWAWYAESARSAVFFYSLAAIFWTIAAPVWLYLRPRGPAVPFTLLAGICALLPLYVAILELRAASPLLLLAIMAIVWISDSVAYFTGKRFGRIRLAPCISPGKTWEGVWGALIAVGLYGLAWISWPGSTKPGLTGIFVSISDLLMIFLIALLAIAGVIGDLFESQLKRQAGVKDSGRILPGHGGLLDRIDALLPVLPIAALFFLK